MKSIIKRVSHHGKEYNCLAFVCPGCVIMGSGSGIHLLAVNTKIKAPAWTWDGNLELPTLSPSILTGKGTSKICHSFLREGKFEFLDDCAHSLAGQTVEMPDLPEWFIKEKGDGR